MHQGIGNQEDSQGGRLRMFAQEQCHHCRGSDQDAHLTNPYLCGRVWRDAFTG